MAKEYPLSLVIKAVDRATAPLRAINARMQKITAPVRRLNNGLRALSDEAGLPRLVKGFGGVGRAVGSVGREAAALAAKLGALTGGAAFALYRITKGAADAGDELATMAQRVGLSVDAYAQLQFAAAQADVEQEAFAGAMDRFNKGLGEAKAGGGSMLAFLQKVSPRLAEQVKGAKSTEAALALMTDAFERVKDPARRAALASAAFGKSGLQMGQFLGQGSAAIDEQRRRFAELAGSQEAFARGAGDLDNAMRETETSFLGLRSAAAGALFPALTELARALTNLLAGNRGRIAAWAREAGAALSSWLAGGGLERLVETMRRWADTLGRLVDMMGGLKGVLVAVGVYMGADFLSTIASTVAWFAKLGGAVLPIVIRAGGLLIPVLGKMLAFLLGINLANPLVWIAALGAALAAAAYVIWKNWEPISAFFVDLWERVKTIAGAVGRFFGIGVGAAGPTLGAAAAAPAPAGSQMGSAHVQVDFANLPQGARVNADPRGTADLDLSMGYAMGAAH
ncbi:hypothetical protein AnaeK_2014 [Anaeromyxobacter sp. K]|uniref:hypothetical protein n=1 Tax=Anaeromyxobacter sp. (strain K) TaxID=447217 RepID=UPI00015F895C|nr:hypothetical protein [Anaeromyxobacter sp. K]ACG73242.1 hypothetical protein AnaeK_2014 [Anaeromyxobacter sp. K]